MAITYTPTDVKSGYNLSAINANFDAIELALANALARDGEGPNSMSADIDLSSNDILNGGVGNFADVVVGGSSVAASAAASVASAAAALVSEGNAATSETNAASSETVALAAAEDVPYWSGAWLTATAYEVGDMFREAGSTYITIVDHTSGTFSTDLSNDKMEMFAQQGASGGGTGDMLAANNLSDVANAATSRANLGLGTAATSATTAFATAAQGVTADSALQDMADDITPQLGGILDTNLNMVKWSKGSDIASSSTITIPTNGNFFNITGTTTITGISDLGVDGTTIILQFQSTLILTHSSSLVLPSSANITTATGDVMIVTQVAGTPVYRCVSYMRRDGTALVSSDTSPVNAWVNFNGTGTIAINADGNISSLTDNGVGDYTLNFTTAMTDIDYAVSGSCVISTSQVPIVVGLYSTSYITGAGMTKTVSSARIATQKGGGTLNVDTFDVSVQITGN